MYWEVSRNDGLYGRWSFSVFRHRGIAKYNVWGNEAFRALARWADKPEVYFMEYMFADVFQTFTKSWCNVLPFIEGLPYLFFTCTFRELHCLRRSSYNRDAAS